MSEGSGPDRAAVSSSAVKIVDAHIHMWNLDENYYPWLSDGDRRSVVSDYSSLRRNYLVSDFFADARTVKPSMEVVGAVHIQAEHDPRDHVNETRWLQAVADSPSSRGVPQAIVGNADLAAEDAQAVLEEHCAHPNMRGIRQALHRGLDEFPPNDPLDHPVFQRNFGLLTRYGLSFDVQYFQQQGEAVQALVRRNPDTQFILTHAGMPLSADEEHLAAWRRNLAALSAFSNVAVKISGFGLWNARWDAGSFAMVADLALDLFTSSRCMLASNYPVERIHTSYAEVWRRYEEYFVNFSRDEREALFGGNALHFYRIDPAKVAPIALQSPN